MLHNPPLPTSLQQGYHEESHHDDRYSFLQASLQAQPQCSATNTAVNICSWPGPDLHAQNIQYSEYDNGYTEDGQGFYLPQDAPGYTQFPHGRSPSLPGPPKTGRSNASGGYRQPFLHNRHPVKSKPSYADQAHHLKASRRYEPSVEPLPKKWKIHDIIDHTP